MTRFGSGIPLVSRVAEKRRLRAVLDRVAGGEATVVLLSGDAGVGKTRLLRELSNTASDSDALVVGGRCLDLAEDGLPYLPFVEALGMLAGSTDSEVAEIVRSHAPLRRILPQFQYGQAVVQGGASPDVGDAVDMGDRVDGDDAVSGTLDSARHGQDLGQLQLFDAVLRVLCDVAGKRTVVVLVEDLHWADPSTRALLSFVASRLRPCRLLLAASYRTDDVGRTHPLRTLLAELRRLDSVEMLDLEPLDPVGARRLVVELTGGELDDESVRRLVVRGAGNPFFTEELAASPAAASGGDLPHGLAELLLARVERLARDTRLVVRALSVADGPASHAALADVTGLRPLELDDVLRSAVHEHVLVVEGQYYGFRHALLREAVYADLMPGERVRLHARYAERLRNNAPERGGAALLAYHSTHSSDLPTALQASVRAAEEAGEWGGAPATALRMADKALQVWEAVSVAQRPEGVDELLLLTRAAKYASAAGQPERAVGYSRMATEALDATVAEQRAATTWRRLAKALAFQDDTEQEAVESIERAWNMVIDSDPSAVRARVLATRAEVMRAAGATSVASWSARAALADADAAGCPEAAIEAQITMAVLVERAGDLDDARDRLWLARRRAERSGVVQQELRAWHFLGLSHDDAGELEEGLRIYRSGLSRAVATGLTWSVNGMELHTRESMLAHTVGEWPVDDDAQLWRGESGVVAARAGAGRLHTAVGQGRVQEAQWLLTAMQPHWTTEVRIAISYGVASSELAYWRGDYSYAVSSAQRAIRALDALASWHLGGIRLATLGLQACVALLESPSATGANVDPRETGQRLLHSARQRAAAGKPRGGVLGPEGRAWLARAEATATGLDVRFDPGKWAEALNAFGYGAVYEQALCRWFYARALLASQSRQCSALAAQQLRTANETSLRLAAEPLGAAVRSLARRAGVPLNPAESTPTQQGPLTARERDVLEQVAAGRTNRQVGDQLFISDKTVSVHLSRLMAKLGAGSRAEAVAIAYDRGLFVNGVGSGGEV